MKKQKNTYDYRFHHPKQHSTLSFLCFSLLCLTLTTILFRFESSAKSQNTPVELDPADDWSLILVNRWNPIPEDYKVFVYTLFNGQKVDERIAGALQEMFDDARTEKIHMDVVSGYRTAEEQAMILEEKTTEYLQQNMTIEEANKKANAWVAIPGTSEHQLGISVDINANTQYSTDDEVFQWLKENAHTYGFINRYPLDKTEITGVIDEPWHYRYVGKPYAQDMQRKGLCLEEYLELKK